MCQVFSNDIPGTKCQNLMSDRNFPRNSHHGPGTCLRVMPIPSRGLRMGVCTVVFGSGLRNRAVFVRNEQ